MIGVYNKYLKHYLTNHLTNNNTNYIYEKSFFTIL